MRINCRGVLLLGRVAASGWLAAKHRWRVRA